LTDFSLKRHKILPLAIRNKRVYYTHSYVFIPTEFIVKNLFNFPAVKKIAERTFGDISPKKSWPKETIRIVGEIQKVAPKGIFATGIENSDPVVDGTRRNQLKEAHDFYKNYEKRLEQIHALGIKWIRFGEGYSLTHLGKDCYNFDFTKKVIDKCNALGMEVIVDLLHFGLPDWMHKDTPDTPYFQNPNFPEYFKEYVKVFTKEFPSIKYLTPVNEPFITNKFSTLDGMWNEQRSDYASFAKAAINIARAAIYAKEAVEEVWKEEKRPGEPLFFQNDSFEKVVNTKENTRTNKAYIFNEILRFATMDLILGHNDKNTKNFFLQYGFSKDDHKWFMERGNKKGVVLGIDHYPTCIHEYGEDETLSHKGPQDEYQLAALVKEYWGRYPLPLIHMEVNARPEHAEDICQKTYDEMNILKNDGLPVLGMSWFGDDLQIGWQSGLTGKEAYDEHRVGLFYKGEIEPVGRMFKILLEKGFLPTQQPIT
jgi:beta-glucosidase